MGETGQPRGTRPVPASLPSVPRAVMLGARWTETQGLAEALQG